MTAPTVLPGRTSERLSLRSRLLFHWRADRLGLAALTGQPPAFVRATVSGHTIGADGRYGDVAPHQPSFQMFDDGSGERRRPGLVVERQQTNEATRSDELDNAAWTKSGATAVANADRAPAADGFVADRLVESSLNEAHEILRTYTITAGESIAMGRAYRADGRSVVRLRLSSDGGANDFSADFNLAAGTVTPNANQGTGVLQNARIAKLVEGWYWCEIGGTVGAAATSALAQETLKQAVGGSPVYAGDGVSGVLTWGGNFRRATVIIGSPIATAGATVTADADELTYAWTYDPAQYADLTFYLELPRPWWADASGTIASGALYALDIGPTGNGPNLRVGASNTARNFRAQINTTGVDALKDVAIPSGTIQRICAQFRSIYSGGYVRLDAGNGFSTENGPATALTAPFSTILVGRSPGAANYWDSGIFCAKIAAGLYTLDQMREMI